jgi:nitrate/nitrite transporter NarK
MKKVLSSLIGGITGAVALNILHQAVKQFDHDAPRVDLVGEEALSKGLEKLGIEPPTGDALFTATMVADLIGNSAYYSIIGTAKKKHLLVIGGITGLAAGIGAITLTKPMGLSDAPVTRTDKTKLLSVGWYTFGGIVAGSVMKALRK